MYIIIRKAFAKYRRWLQTTFAFFIISSRYNTNDNPPPSTCLIVNQVPTAVEVLHVKIRVCNGKNTKVNHLEVAASV